MELRGLEAYGETGTIVYRADCVELTHFMPAGSVDRDLRRTTYWLSGGGLTLRSGRLVSVDKGDWDRSMGLGEDHCSEP